MTRILVIEDDLQMGRLIQEVLNRAGYNTELALNGEQGIRMFRTRNIDILITDIYMPEKDGLEVIKELRAMNHPVKIISISAGWNRGFYSPLNFALDFGADAILKKPFEIEELLDVIEYLINGKWRQEWLEA